jgi:FKBP-type peptidyl-prolyl cis-trans isomerase
MKKILIAGLVLFSVAASAQKKVIKKKPATATSDKLLKNSLDSVSYALGLSVANFYRQQGLKNLNVSCIAKAINDAQAGKQGLFTESEANEVMAVYFNPGLKKNVAEGRAFLAANKNKPGIKTTSSGIQYEILKDAQGQHPVPTDTVVVNYRGTLINGTEFDNSAKAGKPIEFPLNGVIRGWTEGLQLMPVGSKYKFYIPYNLAYGMNETGPIPGGSTLVFEVELLAIKR